LQDYLRRSKTSGAFKKYRGREFGMDSRGCDDVALWHKTDMPWSAGDIRFEGKAGVADLEHTS
jgi:hypothetical protein